MKKLFKSWKFWVIIGVSSVLTVFLALGIVYSTYANIKLATPTNLSVVELSTGEIYAEVDAHDKALSYEFVVWTNENDVEKYISQINILEISDIINTPNNYQIKCRVLGLTENANSNYCTTIEYSSAIKIAQPTIMIKADDNTKLSFSLNDSFSQSVILSFELYYKVNNDGEFLTNTDSVITSGTNYGVAQGYFDLTFLSEIGAGEYSLSVRALCTNNTFYLASDLSDQIVYIVE